MFLDLTKLVLLRFVHILPSNFDDANSFYVSTLYFYEFQGDK